MEGRKYYFRLNYYLILMQLFLINTVLVTIYLFTGQLKTSGFLIVIIFADAAYIVSVFFKDKVVEIIIDTAENIIEIKYVGITFKKSRVRYYLNDLECKYEIMVRARGNKSKVFRLYNKNKCIIELLPNYSGWKESDLRQICEKIN